MGTIGLMRQDFCFSVYHFQRFDAQEDPLAIADAVAKLCRKFRVALVAADGGGNGHVCNRLLWEKLEAAPRSRFYAILYSTVEQQPRQVGVLWKWTVNRSKTIGTLFSRVLTVCAEALPFACVLNSRGSLHYCPANSRRPRNPRS